jgi:hypothetical protein
MKRIVLFAAAGLLASASIVAASVSTGTKTETKVEKKEVKKAVKEKKDCSSYKRHCPFS